MGSGSVVKGDKVEFTVTLGRGLIAGESIEVPLSIGGDSGVSPADWSLSKKTGASLNTGVTLSTTTTATPQVRFSGAMAESATLELTVVADGIRESVESMTVALGPDGPGPNGFDHTSLGTNVDGGADPHGTKNSFSIPVADLLAKELVFSPAGLTVSEGGSGSYKVKLATQPSGEVTVTVGGTSGTDVIVDSDGVEPGNQDRLTFTTATWNSEQAVMVTAGEDSDSTNDSVTLSHTAAGGGYDRVSGSVVVTVTDDHPPTFVLSHSELTVDEGGSGSYTVKLATQPSGDVTVTVGGTSGTDVIVDTDSGETGNQDQLTFTTATWNSEQAVMVTAGEDSDSTNDSVTLSHTAAGGGYDRVSGTVGVTVTDDDPPALVLSHSELTVSEGGSGSYKVKLATQPSGEVTVTVGGTSGTDVIVNSDGVEPGNQEQLTFTTATWNSEQAVIVTAAEDSDSANDSVTISHTAAGGGYDRVRGTIGITVTDNDPPALVLSRSALTVTEGGSGSYKVTLATQPSGEVTVTVGGTYGTDLIVDSNGGEMGNQDRLTFTPATWDSGQAVIVTAAEDSDSANDSVTISHTAAGGGYDKVSNNHGGNGDR